MRISIGIGLAEITTNGVTTRVLTLDGVALTLDGSLLTT
jgi:hypothetical protein